MSSEPFPWPQGARAAVSLTYDDALGSQLDVAAPALDSYSYKATFFLSDRNGGIRNREADWTRLARRGHELAGHTMSHPCGEGRPWLAPGEALEDFDEARMEAEFAESSAWLEQLGAGRPHSYAYTCGQTQLGRPARSYVPLVRRHYQAARGIENRLALPWTEDLHLTAALHAEKLGAAGMTAQLEAAIPGRAWAIFMFHGIGAETLAVTADDHKALLQRLAEKGSQIWVAQFKEVAAWVQQVRKA